MMQGSSLESPAQMTEEHVVFLSRFASYLLFCVLDFFFNVWSSAHVEIRGPLKRLICLLLLCGSWRLSSGHQAL